MEYTINLIILGFAAATSIAGAAMVVYAIVQDIVKGV